MTTAEAIDAIEPERANLSETYAAIRRLVARTLFRDPQSSQGAEARLALLSLDSLVSRAQRLEPEPHAHQWVRDDVHYWKCKTCPETRERFKVT